MRTAINESGYRTFKAGTNPIPLGSRVKLIAVDTIDLAAAADGAIGTTVQDIAANAYGVVKMFSSMGTLYAKVSESVLVGDQLYPSDNGKFMKTFSTGKVLLNYIAIEPASADGDVIQILRIEKGA